MGKEIEFFHQLGRTKNIHFFIVDGEPHSGDPNTECFNPVVDKLGLPEILGANIHEKNFRWPWLNKERAYVQLISKLLEVEFDAIWQRHRRQLIRKTIAWTVGAFAVLATLVSVWVMNQPVDVQMQLNETSVHNENLPPLKDAVVILSLDNKTEVDTLRSMDGLVLFKNIPHKFLNKPVHITVACQNFLPVDTSMVLTKALTLDIARDESVYGDIHFRIWNPNIEDVVPGVTISIAGQTVVSDAEGCVSITVPLSKQQNKYPISASLPLEYDTLHVPCGQNDVVLTK